jgi:cobalt-zinc-cadmium efflux system membrane fusion protein
MQVALKVYEKDLGRVEAGQKVRFLLTNQGNAEVLGKVVSIGKAFEDDTKAVTVLASIGSAPASLIPGMYVNAVIDLGENTVDALPVDAIVKAEGKEFIFLWEKENLEKKAAPGEGADHEAHSEAGVSFARIEVKTGESKLGFVQVIPLTEIHQGDKIVTKGAYYLQSHLLKSEGGGGHPHAH